MVDSNVGKICNLLTGGHGRLDQSLKVCHVNAQSLLVKSHFAEFSQLFSGGEADVVAVSESWLRPYVLDSEVALFGYNIFRCDRVDMNGGGVAIYVRKNITVKMLYKTDGLPGKPEFVVLEIGTGKNRFLFISIYRPPKVGFGSELEEALLKYAINFEHVIVTGDFNVDFNESSFDRIYLSNLFRTCDLFLVPMKSTHITSTSETWIDLMLVSDPDAICRHGQTPVPGLSKHHLIYLVYNIIMPKRKLEKITFRSFRNFNEPSFIDDLQKCSWSEVYDNNDINMKVQTFNSLFLEVLDKHAPFVTISVKRPPMPWLTENIKKLQDERDMALKRFHTTKSKEDEITYKKIRNKVKQEIRNSRIRYTYSQFGAEANPSTFWEEIRKMGLMCKNNNKNTTIPFSLDQLNEGFTKMTEMEENTAKETISLYKKSPRPVTARFSLESVTEEDALKAMMSINQFSKGADKLSINLVMKGSPVTIPVITHIFNHSLKTGTFPDEWKKAVVIPVPKVKNPNSLSDYRPISLLCAISKALEKIVHGQVTRFLNSHNLLDRFQSGFKAGHSTTTALLKVTEDLKVSMDRRLVSLLLLFDFSKAFDRVNHKILLAKLEYLNFDSTALSWFSSYLRHRRQCVSHDSAFSGWLVCTIGVPQGSVLGPLLFTIYIIDIAKNFKYCNYHLYADDLQIYRSFLPEDAASNFELINLDIQSLLEWVCRHGLFINALKTQAMLVGSAKLCLKVDRETLPPILVNDQAVKLVSSVKNLGIIMNENLTWGEQVAVLSQKVVGTLRRLERYRHDLPKNVKIKLVQALIMPLFDYGAVVYYDVHEILNIKLQRLQNAAVRFIFNLRRDDHISPYYTQLKWMQLKSRRKYLMLSHVFNAILTSTPYYFADYFLPLNREGTVPTRSASLLRIPVHRTTLVNNSFRVVGCRLWNNLHPNIRNVQLSADVFKAKIRNALLAGEL